jgi:5-methylcytosine-specific restriction endonuclease McrA
MFAAESLGITSKVQEISQKALVLNASYEPLRIVSWQKALILWFQDKVEILEYHKQFVRSVSVTFELPSVLRMKKYVKPKRIDGVRYCRENLYVRDLYTCQYCCVKFAAKDLTIDHVLPASQGGLKNWTNTVTACRKCNQKKANRTPEKANMPLLKPAKSPAWLPVLEHEVPSNSAPAVWKEYLRFSS